MKLKQYKYIPYSQYLPLVIQQQLNFIYETGSLTNRLRQKYTKVSLKCNYYQQQEGYIRDVIVFAEQKLQWCARTSLPKNTFQRFKILFPIHQKNAIGDFLFTHPSMKRFSLQFRVLPYAHHSMDTHFGLDSSRSFYWLRTSRWCFENEYFFEIIEIF